MTTEDSPLEVVSGKEPAKTLARTKGLRTVGDLLEFVPRRYLATNELTDFTQLAEGDLVVVLAEVESVTTRPMRDRRSKMLTATLSDGRGHQLGLTFFQARYHVGKLVPGVLGLFVGTVSRYRGQWQLTHPEYDLVGDDRVAPGARDRALEDWRGRLMPVYSQTTKVSSLAIRRMVELALRSVDRVREPLPEHIVRRRGLLPRPEAIELIHRPRLEDRPERGLDRLRYDEAFVLQTILAQRRHAAEAESTAPRRLRPGGLLAAFDAALPFELTAGQREVGAQIEVDLASGHPMHRLLQGDVGSGKTVVALRAMLAAVDAGGQAALLVPTEVLAAQHHRSITAMLGPLAQQGLLPFGDAPAADAGTRVALLTGSQTAAARRRTLTEIVTGDAGIVVGTHALIQDQVTFHDLALVVVDEQHRFGVEQRDALREKAATPPHVLVMTATPIPRTVAMTVFGDMETSTLRELPAGRAAVVTHVVEAARPGWLERAWDRIAEEVDAGHQAYVVCPKIGAAYGDEDGLELEDLLAHEADGQDEQGLRELFEGAEPVDEADEDTEGDEAVQLTGVYAMAEQLAAVPTLAAARTEVLHGKLDPGDRDAVMRGFADGEVDVLVATTVVEVGVDVANASVMVVMDAERFGISQLHQLRGRIGRGGVPGLCLLVTNAEPGSPGRVRLDAVAETTDGFLLARRDLQLRREGDVLGARQSGRGSSVRYLRMGHKDDERVIADARDDATALVAQDPTLADHPDLAAKVRDRLDEEQAAYLERG